MPNYSEGKVYRIDDNNGELLYIGSTTQTLSRRLAKHRSNSKTKRCCNYPFYKYVNELESGWTGIKIYLLEQYPCDNHEQLDAREGYYKRELQNKYNKTLVERTKQQYYKDFI